MNEALRASRDKARMATSERLARRLFKRATEDGASPESIALLHAEAEVTPSYNPTVTLSPAELRRHLASRDEPRVVEARADNYQSLDDERVIVEGQIVMKDANGGTGYRLVVWAMLFRDGLLYRSWATSSFSDAEARLIARRPEPAALLPDHRAEPTDALLEPTQGG